MTTSAPTNHPLSYAMPVAKPPPRTWAATAILFGGLVLIGLGGCFLIGVLATVQPQVFAGPVPNTPLTFGEVAFVMLLCLISLACFAVAAVLLFLGTRALLRVTMMA